MNFKYFIAAASLLAFASCEPMKDIYEEIDATENPNTIVKTYDNYVMGASDYAAVSAIAEGIVSDDLKDAAEAVATDLAFNEYIKASEFMPLYIAQLFPTWQQGSVVNVSYDLDGGETALEKNYRSTTITNEQYEQVLGADAGYNYFTSENTPEDNIPTLLSEIDPEAVDGTTYNVTYKFGDVPQSYVLSEDFEDVTADEAAAIEGWDFVSLIKTDNTWEGRSYGGESYVQCSGYKAGSKLDNWMITPSVEIKSTSKLIFDLKFGHVSNNEKALTLYASSSYNGDETAFDVADWTPLTINYPSDIELPTSGYGSAFAAIEVDLSAYAGKDIYLAFRYLGDDSADAATKITTTVQIDNILVDDESGEVVEPAAPTTQTAFYALNGSTWEELSSSDYSVLAAADYDSMGNPGPGQYDNFSSSYLPEVYLPVYLAAKFPYAKEGEIEAVVYKYYASRETSTLIDEYIYSGGKWIVNANRSTVEKETYINANDGWIFDPTVLHTLSNSDYITIVNWVNTNKPDYMDPQYDNSEYWFGASYYHNNFNIELIERRTYDPENVVPADDKEAEAYIDQMVVEGVKLVLETNYPALSPIHSSGAEQFVRATAKAYDGDHYRYVITFEVSEAGKFEQMGEIEKSSW